MNDESGQKFPAKPDDFPEMEAWERAMADVLKKSEPPPLAPEKMEALLATLRPMVAARREESTPNLSKTAGRMDFGEFIRLVRGQASLLERPFWMVMGLIMAGNLALLASNILQPLITTLFLALPLVGGISIVYSLHGSRGGMWEIEQASPAGLQRIFASRLTLMFVLQLLLALPVLVSYGAQAGVLVLARMVLAWLAPTVALSGMILFLFSYWGEWPSVGITVLVWGSLILFGASRAGFIGFAEMVLARIVFNPLLPLLAVLGLAAGLAFGALGLRRLASGRSSWS